MIFAKDTQPIIEALKKKYPVQSGSENLDLGGDLHKTNENLFISATTYIGKTVRKIETLLSVTMKHYNTPLATDDHPETDDSALLSDHEHSIYRLLVGSAIWVIMLGRMDILYATAVLSRFAQNPRKGPIEWLDFLVT